MHHHEFTVFMQSYERFCISGTSGSQITVCFLLAKLEISGNINNARNRYEEKHPVIKQIYVREH